MTTYITAIRLSPPTATDHEHISEVKWSQPQGSGHCSRADMVKFINTGNAVFVRANPDVPVVVVNATPPYLRTRANGKWTDNLLALPRF